MQINEVKTILVIGAGGTGSFLLTALPRFLRFQKEFNGQLIIADGDKYEDRNAERQVFSTQHAGKNKAEYQANVIVSHLPDFKDNVSYIDRYLGQDDIEEFVTENTIVINCVDNLAARKYVEDRILTLDNAVHICCGNEFRDGQVQIHVRRNGESITPSIYEKYPVLNTDDGDRSSMSCEELAALPGGGQLIAANMNAATIAMNFIICQLGGHRMHQQGAYVPCDEVKFNVFQNNFETFGRREIPMEQLI